MCNIKFVEEPLQYYTHIYAYVYKVGASLEISSLRISGKVLMLCSLTGGCQLFKSPSLELKFASNMKMEAVYSSEILVSTY
jgi:hypothetical protein